MQATQHSWHDAYGTRRTFAAYTTWDFTHWSGLLYLLMALMAGLLLNSSLYNHWMLFNSKMLEHCTYPYNLVSWMGGEESMAYTDTTWPQEHFRQLLQVRKWTCVRILPSRLIHNTRPTHQQIGETHQQIRERHRGNLGRYCFTHCHWSCRY